MAGFRVAPQPGESHGLLFRITHIDFQPQEKFAFGGGWAKRKRSWADVFGRKT